MIVRRKPAAPPQPLRVRAEKRLAGTRRKAARLPVADMQKLMHELQVHQIELEMQNDELRGTQLELERTRDRYVDLYDFAPVAHLTLGAQGEILEANLAAAKWLGVERDRLLRQKFTRFIPAGSQDAFHLLNRQMLGSDTPQSVELEMVNDRAGRLVVQLDAVRWPADPRTQFRISFTDITVRKQAEQELRRSEERYRTLIEQAPDGLFVTDREARRILDVNSAACRMLGYAREEAIGLPTLDLVAPEEAPRIATEVARLQSGDTLVTEWQVRRKDGSRFPGEVRARQIPGGLIQGFLHDLTERREAEASIRRSERNLTNFFENAPVGLDWLAASGAILRTNQAQLEMLGYAEEDYRGRFFSGFCVEPARGLELLERLAAKETVRNLRLPLRCKNGAIQHTLVDGVSFWNEDRFQYSAIFVRNITDRVNLEREVLQISEQEHRRIAQDLHDGLGQLLAGTAYLTSMVRQDLAAKSPRETRRVGRAAGDDSSRRRLQGLKGKALLAARRLGRVSKLLREAIAQTRNLARGLHPVEPEPGGLMLALKTLGDRTKSMFQIKCRFTCRRPVLVEDNAVATHLYRIAQEAITNAIKHGRPGRIEIGLTETPDRISLAIKDDGAGIEHGHKRKNGMGLRIMRYRAGMIGGSLAVQKEAGGGTAVVCTVHQSGREINGGSKPARTRKK